MEDQAREGIGHDKLLPAPRDKAESNTSLSKKQALNLRMDVATIRQLKMHALTRGTTASDLVTHLVQTYLSNNPSHEDTTP